MNIRKCLLPVLCIVLDLIRFTTQRDARGCRGLIDIVIVIDGSDSINADDYQLLRETMASFTDNLDIREDEIKLSFVVYSSDIPLQTPITGDKAFLRRTAETLPHPRDGTKTSLALSTMNKIFQRDRREGVPTLGVVFTDGISKDPPKTAAEAKLLRDEGVKLYSVGISKKINDQELQDIAGDKSRVIKLQSFLELKKKLNSFVTLVCPKCPPAPEIKNAVVPRGEFIVETSITYFCKPDYVPVGKAMIQCLLNQTWSPIDFACKADCKVPSSVERSMFTNNDTLEGATAVYTCDDQTVTEGNTTRVCQDDFQWSKVAFYCRPDCGPPNAIKRATIDAGGTLEGAVRTYTCAHSTSTEGNTTITCQRSGLWSTINLYCRPDCGTPRSIPRAGISIGDNLEGTTRTYTCDQNTATEGDTNIICQESGEWTSTNLYCRPDCGIPMNLPRAKLIPGQVVEGVLVGGGTLEGNARRYECMGNTVMEGDPNIVCRVDGTWSPTNLYCRPDCGLPPTFQYASYNSGSTLEGSTITYTCDQNTVREGTYETTCLVSGNWSAIDLFCRPDCGIPMDIARATILTGPTTYQAQREYVCDTGTAMEGSPVIVCQDNFQWTSTDLYCRPDCGPAPIIQYAKHVSTRTTLEGDVITYTCNGDTVAEGLAQTTCLVNGSWSFFDLFCRPNCGIPMNVERATIVPGRTTYGANREYVCATGTVMEGNPIITCQENFKWTTTDLYCRPDCGIPMDIARSTIRPGGTTYQSTREYVCASGTVMEGNPVITCMEDFRWSATDLYCRPDCGTPPTVQYATYTSTRSTLEGDIITYTCAENTVQEGYSQSTCLVNGSWSIVNDLYCRPDCGIPMDIARATIRPGGTTYQSTREYVCASGTVMEGNPVITCMEDFRWSATDLYCRPDCGTPPTVQYATYTSTRSTLEGDIITYTCAENTVQEGYSQSTCLVNGSWSIVNDLYCRPDCGIPMDIARATIRPGGTTYQSTREYVCTSGTVMEGNPVITCMEDFRWSATDLYCRPDCGTPPTVQYATYTSTRSTLEGDIITYTCAENTVQEGYSQSTCLVNGSWSIVNDLYCRPDCGIPMDIARATIRPGGTTYQSTREYVCASGTVMEGNPVITCMEDFRWSATDLYCRPDCGTPPTVQYATYTSTRSTLEGDIITYTCAENTVQEGYSQSTCLVNGSWSIVNDLYCRPDCGIPMDIARATIRPGGTTYQSTREYVCASGTVMEGNPVITCMEDFRWSATDLYCRPDCGTPPTVQYATYTSTRSTLEGDIITYTCAENTVQEGYSQSTCLVNGSWSIVNDLYCRPDCGIPMDIARATIRPGGTTYQSTREYDCASGTVMEGNPVITCMEDFRWSATDLYCRRDCGTPPTVQYATYTSTRSTLEGDIITYTCAENTVQEGYSQSTCLVNGSWSIVNDLYCRPDCGIPMDIARATIRPGGTTYQSTREYVCASGTVMEGNPVITCMEDFRWSAAELYCRPDCGNPPTIRYATYTSTRTTLEGDVITYTCAENTVQEGLRQSTCLVNGSWSAFDLYCRPNCGIPMAIARATIEGGATTYGSRLMYTCAAGTVMEGTPYIICQEDFTWSSTDLYCRPDCGTPPTIQYATYISSGTTLEADVITYTCAENTVAEGMAKSTCLDSGVWSSFDLYCRPNCGIPMDIERGTIKPGPTTYGTTREYVCASGTVLEGNPFITCREDFTWSMTDVYCRPNCGRPPIIQYASYIADRTLEGDTVTYSCGDNTVIEGISQTTCLRNGSWSYISIYCRPNCGMPMDIERASIKPGLTTFGAVREYVCNEGTVMEGNPMIQCQENFLWSTTDLYCRPNCGRPPQVRYADFAEGGTLESDIITYTCQANTVAEGIYQTTCMKNGSWSYFDLYCRPNCGTPMNVEYATLQPGPTTYGSSLEYVCFRGTVMQGNPKITCQEDFTWSKTDLICRPDCGSPPDVRYASYRSTGTTLEGDTATYYCNDNTVLEGVYQTTCQQNGSWSYFDIYCRPNCGIPMDIERATLKQGATTYGAVREYVCASGTVMQGNPSIICQEDFQWSSTNLYCRPDCGQPPLIPLASFFNARTLEGDSVQYSCTEGAISEGISHTTCLKNGTWSYINLYCRPNCGPPPTIRYATYSDGDGTLEGDVVTFSCGERTEMEGHYQTTCLRNGSWSYIDLYCRPNCGIPMEIGRATTKPGLTTYGAVREYVCNEGTVMQGNPSIICQDDFTWSKTDLYCRPNCGRPPVVERSSYFNARTLEGDTVEYTCIENTVTEGIHFTTCQANGTWSYFDLYCRPDCGIPMQIKHGSIKPGPTTYGATREYVCDAGTVMEGNPLITCREDFSWSYSEMYCRPDCGIPMAVERATISPGPTTYGAIREYTCAEGTFMEGHPKIICQEDSTWSSTNLYCRPNCGRPPLVARSSYTNARTLEGDTVHYQCVENTVMEGISQTTCLRNGSWSYFDLYCRPDCGIPMNIPRAYIRDGLTTAGATREYVCMEGTVMQGNPTITCGEDFMWSQSNLYCRPNCGPPPTIPNASFDNYNIRTLEGSTVTYICNGYTVASGIYQTTCLQNGSWSYIDLYCRVNCGQPPRIERATYLPGSTLEDDEITYECDEDTVEDGIRTIRCLHNGSWSFIDLYCKSDCGEPPTIKRGSVRPGSNSEGDVRNYVCDDNYITDGDTEVRCLSNGTWSKINVFCKAQCADPPLPPNARLEYPGLNLEGATLKLSCDRNSVPSGNPTVTCQEDGTWTTPTLKCTPDCGLPMAVPRARIAAPPGATLAGSMLRYECNDGSIPVGNTTTVCTDDGTWTPVNLFCKPDCGPPPHVPRTIIIGQESSEGAIVKYQCDYNTVAEGRDTIICRDDSTWSPTNLYCRPDCGSPSLVLRATIHPTSTLEGSYATYQCDGHSVPEGNGTIFCKSDGFWTRSDFYCRADCGEPPSIHGATVSPGYTTEGARRTYTCNERSVVSGEVVISCQTNGKWTDTNLRCIPDCGRPPSVNKATATAGDTTQGAIRKYICDPDTEGKGDPSIECLPSGSWSPVQVTCNPIRRVKPPPTDLNPLKGPCDDCKMENGVGFNPHPEDCERFTQCYLGVNNEIRSAYRVCPFGQYWDQSVVTCRPSKQVACPKEKCQLPGLVSYPMATTDNCRAYWKCNLGKSIGLCCPLGYMYRPYYGCVEDKLGKCNDTCPPMMYGQGQCGSRPVFDDPKVYEQFIPGYGWRKMPCAPGTHYDHAACGCAFHTSYTPGKTVCKPELYLPFDNDCTDRSGNGIYVQNNGVQVVDGLAYFNGQSELVIPRFSNFEYGELVVSVKFLETPPTTKYVALISNSDCCNASPTMALVKSERNIHYLARCDGGKSTTFHLPIHVGNWNQVHYIHDKDKLEGSCNGIKNEKWALGKIRPTHTAIHIGYGRGFTNFKGYMDEVSIFLCRPSYL